MQPGRRGRQHAVRPRCGAGRHGRMGGPAGQPPVPMAALTLVPWVLLTRVLPTLRTLNVVGAFTSYQSFLRKGSALRSGGGTRAPAHRAVVGGVHRDALRPTSHGAKHRAGWPRCRVEQGCRLAAGDRGPPPPPLSPLTSSSCRPSCPSSNACSCRQPLFCRQASGSTTKQERGLDGVLWAACIQASGSPGPSEEISAVRRKSTPFIIIIIMIIIIISDCEQLRKLPAIRLSAGPALAATSGPDAARWLRSLGCCTADCHL